MQIHVARQQQQLGVFSAEDIAAGLAAGRFHASDLAWREGMAAWTPLGDWAEFRGAGGPASPDVAAHSIRSEIPWEQSKSVGSFFATLKVAVLNPALLATGRFSFGDWVSYCYVAVLLFLCFELGGLLAFEDKALQAAELLRRFGIPELDRAADQIAQSPPTPMVLTILGLFIVLAVTPMIFALLALLNWVGQRIFRYLAPVEQTVSASLLAASVALLLLAPLKLLGFSLATQLLAAAVLFIPVCVVYYRALGAATAISPWAQFGISCFLCSVFCCCCCFLPSLMLSGLPMLNTLAR